MITTPTIMYLGFAMHKIARMEETDFRPGPKRKKRIPIIKRGAARDYEEVEDNGEEDPMIAEESEPEKTDKEEQSRAAVCLSQSIFNVLCNRLQPLLDTKLASNVSVFKAQRKNMMVAGGSCVTA